jgi:S-formylglutathione hydrolase FrmB
MSDDHTAWTRWTSLERYMEGLPMIVVMPDAELSFYTDSKVDPRLAFETYLTRDIIGFIDSTFPTVASRSGRALAGLSMGGYGAAKLALKHPDLYCAAVSFSGALLAASKPIDTDKAEWKRFLTGLFGDEPVGGPDDVIALAKGLNTLTRPALRIDCGTEDFLYHDNVSAHESLLALGFEHEYNERPGNHNWDYWDKAIVDALPFLKRNLGIDTNKEADSVED